ncbi:MAG: hypothetical protein NVS4B3_27490 [Gemmatimonadaceae bacterium]
MPDELIRTRDAILYFGIPKSLGSNLWVYGQTSRLTWRLLRSIEGLVIAVTSILMGSLRGWWFAHAMLRVFSPPSEK